MYEVISTLTSISTSLENGSFDSTEQTEKVKTKSIISFY